MRYIRFQLLAVGLWLLAIGCLAQSNVLRVQSEKCPAGKTLSLPIVMENQSDITGVQFDISVPFELVADEEGNLPVKLAQNRAPYHKVVTKYRGTQWRSASSHGGVNYYHNYRIIVYSDKNDLLLDNSGTLLTVDVPLSPDAENGVEFPVYLLDGSVTLSDRQKQNVLTSQEDGTITIEVIPRPDLQPSDVTFEPSTVNPEGELTVKWKVNNIGQVATEAGWSEQITLVALSGNVMKQLTTTYYDETLGAGASVNREAKIVLPTLLGIDGLAKVQVTIVPSDKTGEHPSLRDNNTASSSSNLTVGKRLTLELSPIKVNEGYNHRISCKLSRSGRWQNIRTFTITSTEDARLDIPKSITIPANQSGVVFYFDVKNNDVLDADSVVDVTVSGDGYDPVTARLIIVDDELPGLTVTSSKTDVNEGETFQLTITAARPSAQPIQVSLTSEDSKRFVYPSTVTIPAGQTTATADVTVVDNEVPNLEQSYKFTASAPNYNKGEVLVMVHDNDMPVLTLTLTPNVVSEQAGPTAVAAVLTRTGKTDTKITVRISDDSDGGLYYQHKSIEMPKGVETVYFNLGPVDNTIKEGDRTYTLTAGVWVSSCNCASSGEQAGNVSATLTVLDNDGASLAVASQQSTVKEGDETKLTITRNTVDDVSQPLNVTLSSDYDAELTYEHNVTIPAGQTSVEVAVQTKKNEVSGDSHTVIFTVAAEGFGSGTCFLLVTDQTLPDARITSFTADVQTAVVSSPVTLTAVVANDGAYLLAKQTPVTIYMKGLSTPLATLYTSQDIPVGGSETLTRVVSLPDNVSDCVYYAIVNESRSVNELVYTNNTSAEVTVKAISPFTATVKTDKQIYRQGDMVTITGQISGDRTVNAQIDVYMINGGARDVKQVTTDANGRFTLEWQLYALQSGHFSIGACFKGDPTVEELAAFDVFGLKRADNAYVTCDVTIGETKNGVIRLVNAGTLPLTGVTTEVLDAPEGCNAQFNVASDIAGNATVDMTYQIAGTVPTSGNDWQQFKVRVTSAEGAYLEIPIYYYARTATGNLVVESQNLTTTMNKDTGRDYSFIVTNNGKGNTGSISLSLPEWMKPLTGAVMPGLDKNDTVNVVLRLMPTPDMQLNVPVTGRLGINCENGNGTYINFSITPVSDKTGTLVVDVTDEFTYYTEEKPHVSGAEIVIKNPVTGALVAQGKSGDDGLFTIDLPEGYYQLNVTVDKHESYKNNILIDPGSTTNKVVCLSYQAISVSWDVEETEVEDEYNIVTTVQYETNVPAPVIEVIEPDNIELSHLGAGESQIYHAVLTNKGLITAQNANYTVPERVSGFKWEPLVECKDFSLSPQQSMVIPVKITRMGSRKDTHGVGDYNNSDTEWSWDWVPNAPEPVVDVIEPTDLDIIGSLDIGGSHSYGVKLKNNGTVPVYDVVYSIPTRKGDYKWEVQQKFDDLTLNPGESIDIPVKVTKVDPNNPDPDGSDSGSSGSGSGSGSGSSSSKSSDKAKPCRITSLTDWRFECGPEGKYGWYPHTIKVDLPCPKDKGGGWYTVYGNGLGSPGGGGGGGGYSSSSNSGNVTVDKDCDHCTNEYLQKWFDCGVSFIPKGGCAYGLYSAYKDYGKPTNDWRYYTTSALTGIGCLTELCAEGAVIAIPATLGGSIIPAVTCSAVGTGINILNCLISLTAPCDENGWWQAFVPLSWKGPVLASRRAAPATEPNWLTSYRLAAEIPAQEQWAFNAIQLEIFGDTAWVTETTPEEIYAVLKAATAQEGTITLDALRDVKPQGISEAQLARFVERLNNSTAFDKNGTESDNRINGENFAKYAELIEKAEAASREMGYKNTDEMWIAESVKFKENAENKGNTVCATITLQINQTMTMTRQAFRGTLTVYNGNKSQAMKDVKLKLNVTNTQTQQVATAKEFEMHTESLVGFKGELPMDAGWYLGTDSTGTATILFIPSKYAAPEKPVDYSFGGTLSYIDPYTDLLVTRELYPVTLTVKPSPELDLTYFMQRDIMGDDALTEEVEPMEPSEFTLIINNKGNGDATNVKMVTNQPEIIDNQKGLLIDFEFLSSQLNGQEKTLALGQAIPTDFGTIPAHTQAYAQWWLQSTLLGHFVKYDIEATHVTSYGNENLSLLDQVTIHELIRGFTPSVVTGTAQRGFLVNDVPDADDQPDIIYFTDATQDKVYELASAAIDKVSDTEYHLTLVPTQAGWSYGNLMDPTVGRQKLMRVVRQSDGAEINLDNLWQTNRTLRDGRDPIKENRLHFVTNMPISGETFILTFAPKPDVELAVKEFVGVPKEGTVATEPVKQLTVRFNKAIDASTFTTDDMTLACQGKQLDASKISITKQTDTDFLLGVETITGADGYYVLTVQTAGITDVEGFNGAVGKQATWIQYTGGKVTLAVKAQPAEGGSVSPASGQYDFSQPITLQATPAEGYEFTRWMEFDKVLSDTATYTYLPLGSADLTAVFTPKYYDITVSYDEKGGTVTGGGTGRYTYGTELELTATPASGWQFDGWMVDGKTVTTDQSSTFNVQRSMTIQALFSELPMGLLTGRVTRTDDDVPIGGAIVTLRSGDVTYAATTDSYGYYQLKVEDKSLTYDLLCQADGFMWSPTVQMWFEETEQTKNFSLLRGATIVLPKEGAGSFSSPVPVQLDTETAKAWWLSKYDQQSFVVEPVADGFIPAGEGVILSGVAGQRIDMSENTSSAARRAPGIMGNMLIGTPTAPYVVTEDGVYQVRENTDGSTRFYLAVQGEVVPKGRAYCQYTISGQPTTVDIIWSGETLINAIVRDINDSTPHFDLQGRRIYKVDADTSGKKIHIVKGRKVIIK